MEGEVAQLAERLGYQIGDVGHLEVLAEATRRARRMTVVYEYLVGGLATDPQRGSALYGPDHLGDARPHVLELGLRHWNAEAGRLAKMAHDAGVDDEQLRISAETGAELAAVMREVAEGLFAVLLSAGVDRALVERVRTEALAGVFQRAIAPLAGAIEAPSEQV